MILLTDILFPSKYAKWRIEGIKAFIDEMDADVLVNKLNTYAGINYDIDYEEMKDYFDLSKFNILIFDPKFNFLNKYNTRLDGTKFNGKTKYSYLFTTKTTFNVNDYDIIYHIFLSSYKKFNAEFNVVPDKQFIHLYPGGGYASAPHLQSIPRTVNIIATQPFCTQHLKNYSFSNYIDVYGSTLLSKNNTIKQKPKNDGILKVCFASMGHGVHKGGEIFIKAVETYNKLYPDDNIEFIFIGNAIGLTKPSDVLKNNLTFLEPMSQHDLDDFYYKHIDILVNAEIGVALNGWPLGAEATLQGSVLITTDVYKANKQFKYDDSMMKIIDINNVTQMINAIKPLHDDRDTLQRMSHNIQQHSLNIFSYDNQQNKIFDFIETIKARKGLLEYRKYCPFYEHENTIYSIKPECPNLNPMQKTHVNIINSNVRDYIFDNIKNRIPFSMTRYNDGEWIAALKIRDNRLYDVHYPKWKEDGQQFVDKKLMPIISKGMSYDVGISSEVMRKSYMMSHISPYIHDTRIFDGGLFARMSIDGTLLKMFELLKTRNVIVIGPQYLEKLNSLFDFRLIETNIQNVWNDYQKIFDAAHKLVKNNPDVIIIYACSFVAKALIDDFYNLYSNTITQLDIGAALDVFCNIDSRPWHGFIKRTVTV